MAVVQRNCLILSLGWPKIYEFSLVKCKKFKTNPNQEGAHFESLDEGVLPVPLDPRYTKVGLKSISVQVCLEQRYMLCGSNHCYAFVHFITLQFPTDFQIQNDEAPQEPQTKR